MYLNFLWDNEFFYNKNLPDKVKLEKSREKSLVEAWKNSEKSAVVGCGEGFSRVNDAGEGRQLEEAGLIDELGVATSIYLKINIFLLKM